MPRVREYVVVVMVAAAGAIAGCSKKAEPAPIAAPSATAVTTPTFEPPPAATPSASAAPQPVATAAPAPKPDATQIKACCAALHTAEGTAAAKDKVAIRTTATVCDGIAKLVGEGKTKHADAITSLRAAAKGAPLPGACK